MPQSKHDLLNNLFHYHSKELLAFAGCRVGDFAAEDLVQETYLRLLQHPEPSSINNPRAYLYKIIANLGFDHHRKENVRSKYAETDEVELDELVSPLPGPEALMEGEILFRNCLTALKTLPEVYLHIFLLSRVNGLTHNEIATNLQLSRQTVERYCSKALSQCFPHARQNRDSSSENR
ncbi:RNA polymerase sigma factor [Candidatus Methylobacter oryzae]|uniref:Sigma-70 family RNA polymerase sigma factor n=1 Tax=Candidatus Methylobacter oryzae TaxID=2497749 RepID=A0ABY3CBD6_9GAMM|nr:sigma-70 family RNA polymerase sigma factor [Candidatus Methylobacter oryzae]TRW95612.1 sigma-70 family RNA polymerase sigma factor [Candidatus Methylobacter oryzae]